MRTGVELDFNFPEHPISQLPDVRLDSELEGNSNGLTDHEVARVRESALEAVRHGSSSFASNNPPEYGFKISQDNEDPDVTLVTHRMSEEMHVSPIITRVRREQGSYRSARYVLVDAQRKDQ